MYKKGLIDIATPPCSTADESKWCDNSGEPGHLHYLNDARNIFNIHDIELPCAFLPHSCDNWVIGGKEEIKTMITDLEAALKQLEQAVK